MIGYISLLLWIFFLYFFSWSYTRVRSESVLITTSKNINKILFFINSAKGISIVSIIIGLFAHFSLIILAVLLFFNDIVQLYAELILRFWELSGISLVAIGEIIETYIKFKRSATPKKRREFLGLMVILICSVGFILYITVRYGLVLCKLIFA